MKSEEIVDPKIVLKAAKVGKVTGVLLIMGALTFSVLLKGTVPAPLFYILLFSGCLLGVAVPSWCVGKLAEREFLKRHSSLDT